VKREAPLKRTTPLRRRTQLGRSVSSSLTDHEPRARGGASRSRKKSGFTPASPAQRARIAGESCLVCGLEPDQATIDPAHLCARAHGGCDEPDCVVPLCRVCHRGFDDGRLDLLPYLRPYHAEERWLREIVHALVHYGGDLLGLLRRLTGHPCRCFEPAGLFERTES
jgi:hypothetical protein